MPDKPHRPIKSFVLRQGRFTNRQRRAFEEQWQHLGLDNTSKPLDYAEVFGNHSPVYLEIGFGNGDYLLSAASARPQHNFIGIEVHRPGAGNLLAEITDRQISNIRISNTDAIQVLKEQIPDHSLSGIYLFFPDPWHKRRHHKRRIVQADFARLIHRKLETDGFIHMATDWKPYAQHMMSVFSDAAGFRNLAGAGNYHARVAERPVTRFEARGHRLGHHVFDLIFIASDQKESP